MEKGNGSFVAGMAICWLLNIAQLGIGWLLLIADVRLISSFYVMVAAIGLTQVGYVVPIWRLLVRKGRPRVAKGLLVAAGITVLLNLVVVAIIFKYKT
ncbi:MAG TPA: hypothetical protein VKU42_07785 [Candidatus Angelobacter sp.]|nr:hypothetical protein [Candidatus Angelobacter sp.]